jgi:hypothetical protein
MQCACVIFSCATRVALQHISTLPHKRHNLKENVYIETKMCVLIFYTSLSEIFLIPRITERDMIINMRWSPCKIPIIFVTS